MLLPPALTLLRLLDPVRHLARPAALPCAGLHLPVPQPSWSAQTLQAATAAAAALSAGNAGHPAQSGALSMDDMLLSSSKQCWAPQGSMLALRLHVRLPICPALSRDLRS